MIAHDFWELLKYAGRSTTWDPMLDMVCFDTQVAPLQGDVWLGSNPGAQLQLGLSLFHQWWQSDNSSYMFPAPGITVMVC